MHLFIYYFLATFLDFSCDVHGGLVYKLTNHEFVTMAKCSDVTILATSYFTHNEIGKCLTIPYKNRSLRKTKQDIPLIFSVFLSSNIVVRIYKVLKKIGNRPETTKSAPSPLKTLALIQAEKPVTEIFIGEKEKWTNKGNDKQEEDDSLLHNTTTYTQYLHQISKS